MPTRILRDWTDSQRIEQLSPEAERLFIRLIMRADDFGRYHADPRLVTAGCLPLVRQVTVNLVTAWLGDLAKAGLIRLYDVDGRKYLEINKFEQRTRAQKSKFPAPCQSNDGQVSVNGQTTALGDGDGDGDGDGCGGGDDAPPACGAELIIESCPAEHKPTAEQITIWARAHGLDIKAHAEAIAANVRAKPPNKWGQHGAENVRYAIADVAKTHERSTKPNGGASLPPIRSYAKKV